MSSIVPLVSVGMPVFNGARWLHAAIESILSQTFQDLELIIADNRSTDESWNICLAYAARDARVRAIKNVAHVGAFENFNIVFRAARGRYFRWASCNDLCAPTHLERCVPVLERHPDVVLSYPRTRLIDYEGRVLEDYEDRLHLDSDSPVERCREYRRRVRLNNVEQGLIRRSELGKTMLQRNFLSCDSLLMAELTLYGKFYEIPEYLFFRRMGPEATTNHRSDAEVAEFFNPDAEGTLRQSWRRFVAHSGMIVRAPISTSEKAQLWRDHAAIIRWSLDAKGQALRRTVAKRVFRPRPHA